MTIEDQIHQWMDENSFNYVSPLDNTLDEMRFLRDVAMNFFGQDQIAEIFWGWEGWEEV